MLARQAEALTDAPQSAMIDAIREELDKTIAQGGSLADFAERVLALNIPGGPRELDGLADIVSGALLAAHLAGRAGE